MKILLLIAFLSAASALPKPATYEPLELPRPPIPDLIDFRPLIVPNEVIEAAEAEALTNALAEANEDNPGLAVNVVDFPMEEEVPAGSAVNFVDSPITEEVDSGDAGVAVHFVDNNEKDLAEDDGIAVNFVDSPVNEEVSAFDTGNAVNVVDSAANEGEVFDVSAVQFVDSPIDQIADDNSAVKFVDSPINEIADDVSAVNFVDSPINEESFDDSVIPVNFVDTPLEPETADIIHIINGFEPISASELETIRIVNIPINQDGIIIHQTQFYPRYPAKIYDNPMLR